MQSIERVPDMAPTDLSPRQRDALAQLRAQRDALVERLENGSRQIEEMRTAGQNVDRWEDFWVKLLHEYERVCDRIAGFEQDVELPKAG